MLAYFLKRNKSLTAKGCDFVEHASAFFQFILFYFQIFVSLMLWEWVIHSCRLIQGMCVICAVILCTCITFATAPHL